MFDDIIVDYEEVYNRVALLKDSLDSSGSDMLRRYRQIADRLVEMDGATNHSIMRSADWNRYKSSVAINVLTSLLSHMNAAAERMELAEQMIATRFRPGAVRRIAG